MSFYFWASRRHPIYKVEGMSSLSLSWSFANAELSPTYILVLSLKSLSLLHLPLGCHQNTHIVCFEWQICAGFLFNDSREESRRPSGGILNSISQSTHVCRHRACWWQIDTVSSCRLMVVMIDGNCRIGGIRRSVNHTWPWLAEQAIM